MSTLVSPRGQTLYQTSMLGKGLGVWALLQSLLTCCKNLAVTAAGWTWLVMIIPWQQFPSRHHQKSAIACATKALTLKDKQVEFLEGLATGKASFFACLPPIFDHRSISLSCLPVSQKDLLRNLYTSIQDSLRQSVPPVIDSSTSVRSFC